MLQVSAATPVENGRVFGDKSSAFVKSAIIQRFAQEIPLASFYQTFADDRKFVVQSNLTGATRVFLGQAFSIRTNVEHLLGLNLFFAEPLGSVGTRAIVRCWCLSLLSTFNDSSLPQTRPLPEEEMNSLSSQRALLFADQLF